MSRCGSPSSNTSTSTSTSISSSSSSSSTRINTSTSTNASIYSSSSSSSDISSSTLFSGAQSPLDGYTSPAHGLAWTETLTQGGMAVRVAVRAPRDDEGGVPRVLDATADMGSGAASLRDRRAQDGVIRQIKDQLAAALGGDRPAGPAGPHGGDLSHRGLPNGAAIVIRARFPGQPRDRVVPMKKDWVTGRVRPRALIDDLYDGEAQHKREARIDRERRARGLPVDGDDDDDDDDMEEDEAAQSEPSVGFWSTVF